MKLQNMVTFKYYVGDTVGKSKLRDVFKKDYEQNYTVFYNNGCIVRDLPVHRLTDFAGEAVKGMFLRTRDSMSNY